MIAGKFFANNDGAFAVIFGLALVPLALATGAAIDYSKASATKTELQAATDAAALAAAKAADLSIPERTKIGQNIFAANFNVPGAPAPTFTFEYGVVKATATYRLPSTMMTIAGFDHIDIKAEAEAAARSRPICILILEPKDIGISANSDAKLETNCGIQVNSTNNEAIFANSNSVIKAAAVCITGRYRTNSGGQILPTPDTNCAPVEDPLASLPEPSIGPCKQTDFVVQNGETRTIDPGTYCKKLVVNSGGTLKMRPGVYVFPESEFHVNSNSTVVGEEVTLFFSGKSGRLDVKTDGLFQISAPKTGIYQGVVLFQSRDKITLQSGAHVINSHADSYIDGTVYVPNGHFLFNSHSTMNTRASYTFLIARRLDLNSFGKVTVMLNFDGKTPLPPLLKSAVSNATTRLVR